MAAPIGKLEIAVNNGEAPELKFRFREGARASERGRAMGHGVEDGVAGMPGKGRGGAARNRRRSMRPSLFELDGGATSEDAALTVSEGRSRTHTLTESRGSVDVRKAPAAVCKTDSVVLNFHVGARVKHPQRGSGCVSRIDLRDARGKPFMVTFDNGQVHHYNAESMKKMVKDGEVPHKALGDTHPRTRLQAMMTMQQSTPSLGVAFSADGGWLATGDDDGKVTLYQATGELVLYETLKREARVRCVAFSPILPNGMQYVAVGGDEKLVAVYGISSHGVAPSPIHTFVHTEKIFSVAFPADGPKQSLLLCVCGADKRVTVYDLLSEGKVMFCFEHQQHLNVVTITHDAALLATGGFDNRVTVYNVRDTASENGPIAFVFERDGAVNQICFSADSQLLAVGGFSSNVTVHDLSRGGEILHTLLRSTCTSALAFSVKKQYLVVGGYSHDVTVYELGVGSAAACIWHAFGQASVVSTICISNADLLAVGSKDGRINVYDLSVVGALVGSFRLAKSVRSICFSADSRLVAAAGFDSRITVYDMVDDGSVRFTFERSEPVRSVSFSSSCVHDFPRAASNRRTVPTRLTVPDSPLPYGPKSARGRAPTSCSTPMSCNEIPRAHSRQSQLLAAGGDDKTVIVYDLAHEGRVVHSFSHVARVLSVSLSSDSMHLAVGGHDEFSTVYDLTAGQILHQFKHTASVLSVVLSTASLSYMAAGGNDNRVSLYDYWHGSLVHTFDRSGPVLNLAFSADDRLLAAAGDDNKVLVYDVTKLGSLLHSFDCGAWVYSVAFSPDARYLASGGFDKVVSVRDLAAGGLLLHEFQQERTVFKVVFSPDSRFLAAGGEDAVLQIYCPSLPPIPSEVPLSTLGELAESKPWILGCHDETGRTVLHRAVEQKGEASVDSLMRLSGIEDLRQDLHNQTPLDLALELQSHPKCRVLLEKLFAQLSPDSMKRRGHHRWIDDLPRYLNRLVSEGYNDLVLFVLQRASFQTDRAEANRMRFPPFWVAFQTDEDLHAPAAAPALFKKLKMFKQEPEVEVVTFAIGFPHLIRDCFSHVVENCPLNVFETQVIRHIVKHLWLQLRWEYYLHIVLYSTFMIFFSLAHYLKNEIQWGDLSQQHLSKLHNETLLNNPSFGKAAAKTQFQEDAEFLQRESVTIFRALYCVALFSSLKLIHAEWAKLRANGPLKHFRSAWNWFQALSYTAVLLSILFTEMDWPCGNLVNGVAIVGVWTGSALYLRGLKKYGHLIFALGQVLSDIQAFCVVVLIIMIGFALGLLSLMPDNLSFRGTFWGISVFRMWTDQSDMAWFDPTDRDGIDDKRPYKVTKLFALFFYVLYIMLLTVVMMNLLIAIINDTYVRIMLRLDAERTHSRAAVIVDLLLGKSRELKKKLFPRWLHVCVRKDKADWVGISHDSAHADRTHNRHQPQHGSAAKALQLSLQPDSYGGAQMLHEDFENLVDTVAQLDQGIKNVQESLDRHLQSTAESIAEIRSAMEANQAKVTEQLEALVRASVCAGFRDRQNPR